MWDLFYEADAGMRICGILVEDGKKERRIRAGWGTQRLHWNSEVKTTRRMVEASLDRLFGREVHEKYRPYKFEGGLTK